MKIDIKIKDKKVLQASRSISVTLCKTLAYIKNVKPFHGVVASHLHKYSVGPFFSVHCHIYYRRHFIKFFKGEKNMLLIARENRDGSLLWNIISTSKTNYIDGKRKGRLLYKK